MTWSIFQTSEELADENLDALCLTEILQNFWGLSFHSASICLDMTSHKYFALENSKSLVAMRHVVANRRVARLASSSSRSSEA